MAANMLEGVDREEWKARGLSEGVVMFALALGSILLRINSIELGLKHILDREMGRSVPKKHDLVILWNRLTDEWKEEVAEASCVPMEDIREALGQYKDAAVTLRYGGPLQTTQPPVAETMRKHAAVPDPEVRRTFGSADHSTSSRNWPTRSEAGHTQQLNFGKWNRANSKADGIPGLGSRPTHPAAFAGCLCNIGKFEDLPARVRPARYASAEDCGYFVVSLAAG